MFNFQNSPLLLIFPTIYEMHFHRYSICSKPPRSSIEGSRRRDSATQPRTFSWFLFWAFHFFFELLILFFEHPDQMPQRSQLKDISCQNCQNSQLKNVTYLSIFLWDKLSLLSLPAWSCHRQMCPANMLQATWLYQEGNKMNEKISHEMFSFKESRIRLPVKVITWLGSVGNRRPANSFWFGHQFRRRSGFDWNSVAFWRLEPFPSFQALCGPPQWKIWALKGPMEAPTHRLPWSWIIQKMFLYLYIFASPDGQPSNYCICLPPGSASSQSDEKWIF